MKPFAFERARNVDHALSLAAAAPGAAFVHAVGEAAEALAHLGA